MKPALKHFPKLKGLTYGPVVSRRLGLSLGVNLVPGPEKLCSFNCPYCQLGWTKRRVGSFAPEFGLPTPEEVSRAVQAEIRRLNKLDVKLDRITFSGNGEPTAHPLFEPILEAVRVVRDKEVPDVWIAVLTNGAHLDRPDVVRGLNRCDEPIVKFDAGNERMFRALNKPRPGLTLADIVHGLRLIRRPTIQTMFVTGSVDNTTPSEVDDWVGLVTKIKPTWSQIYTLDRIPADGRLLPVNRARLMEISMQLSETCGIQSLVIFPE